MCGESVAVPAVGTSPLESLLCHYYVLKLLQEKARGEKLIGES